LPSSPFPSSVFSRAIVIVLDSVGIGAMPDAAQYGDQGSNTVGNIAQRRSLAIPTLRALGLDRLVALPEPSHAASEPPADAVLRGGARGALGAFGRMAERSAGKDSVTGHWEMMGLALKSPFPTFPHGFPRDLITEFEAGIGRRSLGNVAASGTVIIDQLGAEHMKTGWPIVYTSADSVFQIAAHEAIIPIEEQYRLCQIAFELVARGLGVGRVIARPFVGQPGSFKRTAHRRDFALAPAGQTLLDLLTVATIPVVTIGKIADLFAGRGTGRSMHTSSDQEGMERLEAAIRDTPAGLLFANLVDFDTLYGHRNDVDGYAANLERFDRWLASFLPLLAPTDLMVITADHGNDPTTPSTDHSREYVPVLITGDRVRAGVDLGTRTTFADLGQSLAANFGVGPLDQGTSFLEDIVEHHS
jgi:phosphopentomutase